MSISDKCGAADRAHEGLLHEHDVQVSRTRWGKIILCEKHERAYPKRVNPKTGEVFARSRRTAAECPCRLCIPRKKAMAPVKPNLAPAGGVRGEGMKLPVAF